MKILYLAGPIHGILYEEAVRWRDEVSDMLSYDGFECLNPLRGKAFLADHADAVSDHYDHPLASGKAIVERDLYDIERSNFFLLNTIGVNEASTGSLVELGYARCLGLPIVTVLDKRSRWDRAWVREPSSYVVETLDEAITVLRTL